MELTNGDNVALACWFIFIFIEDDPCREWIGVKEAPWVLKSSLQCGDQCKEYMKVLSGIVCIGSGEWDAIVDVLHTLIFPSGEYEPVARRSVLHEHQDKAYKDFCQHENQPHKEELTFTDARCDHFELCTPPNPTSVFPALLSQI